MYKISNSSELVFTSVFYSVQNQTPSWSLTSKRRWEKPLNIVLYVIVEIKIIVLNYTIYITDKYYIRFSMKLPIRMPRASLSSKQTWMDALAQDLGSGLSYGHINPDMEAGFILLGWNWAVGRGWEIILSLTSMNYYTATFLPQQSLGEDIGSQWIYLPLLSVHAVTPTCSSSLFRNTSPCSRSTCIFLHLYLALNLPD